MIEQTNPIFGTIAGVSTSTSGNISIINRGTISATEAISAGSGGQVSLDTSGSVGNIFSAGGTITTTGAIVLNAGGGIGVGGAVNTDNAATLSLTTAGAAGAGNITLVHGSDFDTGDITLATDGASEQTVTLTALSWDVDGALGAAQDNLTLTASGGNIDDSGDTDAVLTAATLTLNASGGIGTTSDVNYAAGTGISLTTAGTDAAGDITVTTAAAETTSDVTFTTAAGSAQTVSLTAGSWDVDAALGNSQDNLTLTASGGNVDDVSTSGAVLTAEGLTLSAGLAIGNISTLNIDASTLDASGGGAIDITEANSIALNVVNANGGASNVTIEATTGAITDNSIVEGAGNENIVGDLVTLTAAAGIGETTNADTDIDTNANTIVASTTGLGDVVITETDTIQLGDGTGGIGTADGGIHIAAGGEITTGNTISTSNNGSIDIRNSAGNITLSNVVTANSTGAVTLDAAGSLAVNAAVSSGTGAVDVTGGTGVSFGATGSLTTSGFAPIDLTATAGSILDTANDVLTDIDTNGAVTLTAGGGSIGSAAINGQIDIINTTNITVNSSNGAFVGNNQDLSSLDVNLDPSGTAALVLNSGTTSIDIGDDLSGNLQINNVSNVGSALDFDLTSTGGIRLVTDAINNIGSGNVVLSANGTISDAGATSITTTGNLSLTSVGGLNISGAVTGSGGVDITNTGGGNITYRNTGALNLNGLSNSGGGVVDEIVIRASSPLTINAPVNGGGALLVLAAEGITVADDLTINAAITNDSADIELYAGHDVIHNRGLINTTTSGNISVAAGVDYNSGAPQAGNADGDITMADGVQINSAGTVTMTATADISLGEVVAATTVNITAGGSINDTTDDTVNDISGTTVTLIAADEIGGNPAAAVVDTRGALEVTSTGLNADVTAGNIVLSDIGGTELTGLDTDAGAIDILSNADLTIGLVEASTTVRIESTGGSINDAADDLVNDITGTTVTLIAADEIGGNPAAAAVDTRGALEVTSTGLNADVTAGNIVLSDIGGTELTGLDTDAGAIDILSNADLTIGLVEASTTVRIESTGGSINDAADDLVNDITGTTVTLTAVDEIGGNVTAGSAVDTLQALEVTATALDVSTTNAVANAAAIVLRNIGGTELSDLDTVASDITVLSDSDLRVGNAGVTTTTGKVALNSNDNLIIDAPIITEGGLVELNAGNNISSTAAGTITTTAAANSGTGSGSVQIDAASTGWVTMVGAISTVGASNNAGKGSDGGALTIDTVNGTIALADITSSGGASTFGGADGGAAGAIAITTGTNNTITLNGSTLTAAGGAPGAGGTQGTGGTVTISDPALLGGGVVIDTGATAGDIQFSGSLNGAFTLALKAGTGDINFVGTVGNSSPLGAVTINEANNVTLSDTFDSAGLNQSVSGTGTTRVDRLLTSTGPVTLDAATIDLNAGIKTQSGGAQGLVTLNAGNGGVDLAAGQAIATTADIAPDDNTISGAVDINVGGTGTVNLAGNIVTTGDDNTSGIGAAGGEVTIDTSNGTITLADITTSGGASTGATGGSAGSTTITTGTDNTITLNGSTLTAVGGGTGSAQGVGGTISLNDPVSLSISSVVITTGETEGDINFTETLSGAQTLDLTAGTGNITFARAVGAGAGQELGAITIVSAADVTAQSTIEAASLEQQGGTGDTQFDDQVTLDTAAGMSITTNTVTIDAGIDTLTGASGGGVTITNAGSLTITANGDMNLDGAFLQDGIGAVSIAGNITTTDDNITFQQGVTLTDALVELSTGAGTGTIAFNDTLDGADDFQQGLNLTAGTGNIDFDGVVGGTTDLGAVTIISAADVTADAAFNANSLEQQAGTGDTQFDGRVTLDAPQGMSLITNTVTINAEIDTLTGGNGGTVTITNAGSLTIVADGDMSLDGAFLQNGAGAVSTAGNITTTDDNITFQQSVTLTDDIALSTGSGTGTIAFNNTLDGTAASQESLELTAGSGNIDFADIVGNTQLGDMTIVSAADVTAQATIDAASLVQSAGSGTTRLQADVTTTTAAGVDISTGTIALDGLTISASGNGVVRLNAATVLEDITVISSTGSGAITFESTLDSDTGEANPLQLIADTGNISFVDEVGSGANQALGPIAIDSAVNVRAQSTITAASLVQSAGSGITTLSGDISTSAPAGVDITANAISLGLSRIDAVDGDVSFSGPVTLIENVRIDTTGGPAGDGSINFGGTIQAEGPATSETLTLIAGQGNIGFNATVGIPRVLGSLTVEQADAVTFVDDSDVRIQNGLTISNVNAVSLGSGVDLTVLTGTIDMNDSVTSIDLTGTGSINVFTASAGSVELSNVIESGNVPEFEINASDNATLAVLELNSGDDSILDINGGAVSITGIVTAPAGFTSDGTTFQNTASINSDAAITIRHEDAIAIEGPLATTSATEAVTLSLTAPAPAGTISATALGDITTGGSNVNIEGDFVTAGDITVASDGTIIFSRTVTLINTVDPMTFTTASGIIDFRAGLTGNTVDGERLILNAGTGSVRFRENVGATRIGLLNISSATSGVTADAGITANEVIIASGGDVDLNSAVSAPSGFTSAGTDFDNTGGPITSTSAPITLAHSGTVILGGEMNAGSGGAVTLGGGGTFVGTATVSGASVDVQGTTIGLDSGTGPTINTPVLTVDLTSEIAGQSGLMTAGANLETVPPANLVAPGLIRIIGIGLFSPSDQQQLEGLSALSTLAVQQEKLERQLRESAKAQFFMTPPLEIYIDIEEEEQLREGELPEEPLESLEEDFSRLDIKIVVPSELMDMGPRMPTLLTPESLGDKLLGEQQGLSPNIGISKVSSGLDGSVAVLSQ